MSSLILTVGSFRGGPLSSSIQQATSTKTETSTTDVLMPDMIITTPASGTYAVFASASVKNSGASNLTHLTIYSGNGIISQSKRSMTGVDFSAMSSIARVVVDGTDDIEIRWRVSAGTGTVEDRQLMIVKVG